MTKTAMMARAAFASALIGLFATGFAAIAQADEVWPAEAIYRGAILAPDLTFPDKAQTGAADLQRRMTLMKPEGDGPSPPSSWCINARGLTPR